MCYEDYFELYFKMIVFIAVLQEIYRLPTIAVPHTVSLCPAVHEAKKQLIKVCTFWVNMSHVINCSEVE